MNLEEHFKDLFVLFEHILDGALHVRLNLTK